MLTVISFNIMFNDILLIERHYVLIVLLLKNNEDVICLQEVLKDLSEFLVIHLKPMYKCVCETILPKDREYGEMIFVKKDLQILDVNYTKLYSKMNRYLL